MAKKGERVGFLVIIVAVMLSPMVQTKLVAGGMSSNVYFTETYDSNNIGGIGSSNHFHASSVEGFDSVKDSDEADEYDYDFYRKHENVPSPGIGH